MCVARGSVIGPFLFLVYINDIASNLGSKSMLYADDISIITKDRDLSHLEEKRRDILDKSSAWLQANKLFLNLNKTEVIYFHLINLNSDDHGCTSVKLLGINLDTKLTWNIHTQNLCKKTC